MELTFEISGDQIDGARDYQEDAFLVSFLDDEEGGDARSAALVIMADGMGGHAAGNIASNLVVSTFNKSFTGGYGSAEVPDLMRTCLDKANEALSESIKETPALDGMGCTMVTGFFSKGKANWISVGDSHLYVLRDNVLKKYNEDHSYGGYLDRMKAQGIEIEAEPGLSRNMLMSAMTGDAIAEIDCPTKPLQLLPGDRLIVSSDGLDTLSEGAIIQACTWAKTAKECVGALLKAVEDAKKPRQDNTTVVVVDVIGKEAPPPPTPEPPPPASDLQDTQELSLDQLSAATARESVEPMMAPPPGRSSRTGIILAILLVVLLGAGAGVYFTVLQPRPGPIVDAGGGAVEPVEGTGQSGGAGQAGPVTPPVEPPAVPLTDPGTGSQQAGTGAGAVEPPVNATPEFVEIQDPMNSGGTGPVMIALPGGAFEMGARSFGGERDELPRRTVTVAPFAIGKYEVTTDEYSRFASVTGRVGKQNSLSGKGAPVVGATWDEAYAYANWLSRQTGKTYRLPSEAEWEYAARGGTTSTYWWGFDPKEEMAHCFDCQTGLDTRLPTKVGRFSPNPFGLYDTAGNVYEWVRDCYHKNYTGAPATGGVWEGGDCTRRVARGGSYSSTLSSLRSANREKRTAKKAWDDVGFRLVRELD